MTALLEFVAANWIRWLFAVISAVLGFLYHKIATSLREEQAKSAAISAGVQALLRESIVNAYNRYSDKGYCPIFAKESLRRVYQAYHDLDGNDVATELYRKILAMPEERRNNDDTE